MILDKDDPRLTAYALGELEGEEAAAVEREVKASAALQGEVEQIRRLAGELTAELKREKAPAANLHASDIKPAPGRRPKSGTAAALVRKPWRVRWAIPASIAACLLGAIGWGIYHQWGPPKDESQISSANTEVPGPSLSAPARPLNGKYEKGTGTGAAAKQGEMTMASRAAYGVSSNGPQPRSVFLRAVAASELPAMRPQMQKPGGGVVFSGTGNGYHNTEAYDQIVANPFLLVGDEPLSTFSIDVDTASYSNVRRYLQQGQLPPKGAVRAEEMINYFRYDYRPPSDGRPFAVHVEAAGCPWNTEHRLVRIALKGKEIPLDKRPPANLVFLLDVSGSMQSENKLPLVKAAMKMLVEQLTEHDSVGIVTYASGTGVALQPTSGDKKATIIESLDRLQAGGSTNGAGGIQAAYELAAANFIKSGINRVILCTDGDFNVGISDDSSLVSLIEGKAKSGVFLSVMGFGMGNLKDAKLEKLADKGNGNYGYIDTLNEARKVFVEQMAGTLMTIAKDVKIQVEFNPAKVQAYRLIGYENRMLRKEDFNDDKKDAGEIGAGHTVTALYEVVPPGVKFDSPSVDELKYQATRATTKPATQPTDDATAMSDETLTVKLRYKQPDGDKSVLIQQPLTDNGQTFAKAGEDFRFAAGVAAFAMLLADNPSKGTYTIDGVIELVDSCKGKDVGGYRAEFVELAKTAKGLMATRPTAPKEEGE